MFSIAKMTIITQHQQRRAAGRASDDHLWLGAKSSDATGEAASGGRSAKVRRRRRRRRRRQVPWPAASSRSLSGHLFLLFLLLLPALLASPSDAQQISGGLGGSELESGSKQSNTSSRCGPMKQPSSDMSSRLRQQRQQLAAASQATDDNATLASSSNVTGVRRYRRHAAPGAVQLQEARRKGATGNQQAAGKRQVIQALLGGQASLDCNIQPAEADDAVSLVLWYKDKSMVPIYSLDARATHIQEARHKPGPWLEGRSSMKIFTQRLVVRNRRQVVTDGEERAASARVLRRLHKSHRTRRRTQQSPAAHFTRYEERPGVREPMALQVQQHEQLMAHLHVEALSSEDNGHYLCRVDFRKARSRTQEFVLKIIVPADKPTIRDLSAAEPEVLELPAGPAPEQTRLVGPHGEGARVVLLCETQGGYPEPALSWWRDGRLVDDSYEVVSADGRPLSKWTERDGPAEDEREAPPEEGAEAAEEPGAELAGPPATATLKQAGSQNRLIRNRLELNGVTRADLLANYSCQARNTKLSEPPSSSVMIDMNLRPIKVQIENERQPVLADKPLELLCRALGSRPPALISWWRNGQRLPAGPGEGRRHLRPDESAPLLELRIQDSVGLDSNASSSTLTFVPQIDDAGQTISCKAENPRLLSQGGIEDSWKLDVHYLPRVRLALGEKLADAPVREGHDVYFECSVRAAPAAHEVRWWFAGRELESNVSAGVIISNQSLVLQHVGRHQRGRYTCSALNAVGESHSNGVHLRVQFAPYCRDAAPHEPPLDAAGFSAVSQQRHKTQYGAARLEPVKVYCHVDADPLDQLSYRWAFVATNLSAPAGPPAGLPRRPEFAGQQLVYLDQSLVSSLAPENPLVGVASYTPRSELDYGTLLCWAHNALGEQAEPCAYQVVPAERPDPVRNCRLLNASEAQLAVACEPGYDGGIEQSFQMEVYDARRHELVANVSAAGSTAGARAASWWLAREPPEGQPDGAPPAADSDSAAPARQQKQRHSSATAAGQTGPPGEEGASHSAGPHYETVLLTEPNLEPATDYLLSIYSANSKGASKRVAFTATTANLTGERPTAQVRDGRKIADPSHLLGDVLALSWHPFLLVCAVTLGLFIMFASISFAMMKYVDFSSSPRGGSGAASALDKDPKSADKAAANGLADSSSSSRRSDSPASEETLGRPSSRQRARVISLAGAAGANNNNNSTLSDREGHCDLPLNGAPAVAAKDKASLLHSGAYLRTKLQQLMGVEPSRLKQSSSETYLNQLASVKSIQLQRNQQQASFCGTLPRNLSTTCRFHGPQRHLQQQQQFAQLESALGDQVYNKSLSSATNSETGYSANTNTSLDSQQLQPPTLTSLVLANGAANNNSAATAVYSPASYLPLGEARVEQLVISGKQYIHQTSAASNRMANFYLLQQQQPHQAQTQSQSQSQRHHLQMTSAPYGSLQRTNLYATSAMKDYHSQQQQPLVFINQQHQSTMMSSADQQRQMGAGPRAVDLSYAPLPASDDCALLDGANSSFSANTKTSDLGSDSPPAEAGVLAGGCHVAHLTLIDGASGMAEGAGPPLDSDGLSSGTQRSFACNSNGSPSSGLNELDQTYLYRHAQLGSSNQCCALQSGLPGLSEDELATSGTTLISLTSGPARKQQQHRGGQAGKLPAKTGLRQNKRLSDSSSFVRVRKIQGH